MAVKLFVGGLAFITSSDRLRDTFGSFLDGRFLRVELSAKPGSNGGARR